MPGRSRPSRPRLSSLDTVHKLRPSRSTRCLVVTSGGLEDTIFMPPPNKQAFEVHGDIRAKYEALGGASGPLGLPLTDETVAPDGRGRYNHFEPGRFIGRIVRGR